MIRRCIIIDFSIELNRHICVDEKNADDIFIFLSDHEKQFQTISDRILRQSYPYFTNYFKLTGYGNLSEMRFNVGGANGRIYCQEIKNNTGGLCVVLSRLYRKKTTMTIDKKIKKILEAILKYEYQIII